MNTIASVGAEVPYDLLVATGRYAGPLGWNIDREFPRATKWLESKFAPWTFSILEDWAAGAFDQHAAVVFTRADDNAQRLYYYICELQRQGLIAGPEPILFDVAQIARPSSLEREVDAVRALAGRFGLDDEGLEAGIAKSNLRRGSAVSVAGGAGQACLLAGTPAPDHRVHQLIERSGWRAAGATLDQMWADPGSPVVEKTGDPVRAIARQVHAGRGGNRSFIDRAAAIIAEADSAHASAAILWYIEEDEALVWHLPAQRAALEAEGIPVLILTRRDWRATDGVGDEIAAFLAECQA